MEKKKENAMGQLIRISILSWSAALLTASYAGLLAKMDPTFIATVFTASAATFGINTMKKGGEEEHKEDVRRDPDTAITAVEPTPEPEPPADIATADTQTAGCPNCDPGDSPDYSRATTRSEV